jgi:ribosomal protein S24E
MSTLTKAQIKEKLAKVLKVKEECITIFGMKTKFGGGRASAFALIYESLDAKKKYDSKASQLRVSHNTVSPGAWTKDAKKSLFSCLSCLFLVSLNFL